jgi:hypothetical protein
MWRSLKQMVFWALLIAAFAVVVTTALGDHEAEHGSLTLPPGGTVELPEGTVKVFYDEGGEAATGTALNAPLRFQVVPAAGGAPLTNQSTSSSATSTGTQRSEDLISRGSVAKLEVPSEGEYVVTGGNGVAPGVIKFGTDPFSAVTDRWRLLAVLLGGALLVTFIPVPRTRGSGHQDAVWAAD